MAEELKVGACSDFIKWVFAGVLLLLPYGVFFFGLLLFIIFLLGIRKIKEE